MAEPSAGAFTIREIRPDDYEALGELTVRAYAAVPGSAVVRDPSRDWEFAPGEWLWSFVLRFEEPG